MHNNIKFRGLAATYAVNVLKVSVFGILGLLGVVALIVGLALPMLVGWYFGGAFEFPAQTTPIDYLTMGAQFVWFALFFAAIKTADEWEAGDD